MSKKCLLALRDSVSIVLNAAESKEVSLHPKGDGKEANLSYTTCTSAKKKKKISPTEKNYTATITESNTSAVLMVPAVTTENLQISYYTKH